MICLQLQAINACKFSGYHNGDAEDSGRLGSDAVSGRLSTAET